MPALVAGIHVFFLSLSIKDVDARHKVGHDAERRVEENYSLISPRLMLAPSFASTVFLL
jgi:hypothetical protein